MHIAVFITLLVISYRSAKAIRNNSNILEEFKQSKILSILVFIYPIGPLLMYTSSVIPLVIIYPLAAACYIPQLIIARKQNEILSCTGTDRVYEVKKAISLASLGALIGLVYLSAGLIMTIATYSVSTSHY